MGDAGTVPSRQPARAVSAPERVGAPISSVPAAADIAPAEEPAPEGPGDAVARTAPGAPAEAVQIIDNVVAKCLQIGIIVR